MKTFFLILRSCIHEKSHPEKLLIWNFVLVLRSCIPEKSHPEKSPNLEFFSYPEKLKSWEVPKWEVAFRRSYFFLRSCSPEKMYGEVPTTRYLNMSLELFILPYHTILTRHFHCPYNIRTIIYHNIPWLLLILFTN